MSVKSELYFLFKLKCFDNTAGADVGGWLGWLVTPLLARQPISCYYDACDLSNFDVVLYPSCPRPNSQTLKFHSPVIPDPPQCSLAFLVVVSGVRQWTKLTHVGPRYNWDGWPSSSGYTISGCNQLTRSTQPCIPPGSHNRVPTSAGVKAGMSRLPGGR